MSEKTNRKFKQDDFEWGEMINSGLFCETYLCQIKGSKNEKFAIKKYSIRSLVMNKLMDSVLMEKRALFALNHPLIIKIQSFFEDSDFLYFVMEYCPENLEDVRKKFKGAVPLRETMFYVIQLLSVLVYLKTQKVVHRDIRPENILVGENGYIRVTGFKTVKLYNCWNKEFTCFQTQSFVQDKLMEKLSYLSPEIIKGAPCSYGADLWSLGIIFFRFLTNEFPFQAKVPFLLINAIKKKEIQWKPMTFVVSELEKSSRNSENLELFKATLKKYILIMDFFSNLFIMKPKKRLGCGSVGISKLLKHPIFQVFQNSQKLRKKIIRYKEKGVRFDMKNMVFVDHVIQKLWKEEYTYNYNLLSASLEGKYLKEFQEDYKNLKSVGENDIEKNTTENSDSSSDDEELYETPQPKSKGKSLFDTNTMDTNNNISQKKKEKKKKKKKEVINGNINISNDSDSDDGLFDIPETPAIFNKGRKKRNHIRGTSIFD